MYTFSYWNRQLCLRPEFTASVIRAYLNHLQDRPLPLRVQYAGPTFRYERPQEEHHRQWTEIGAECVGASGPAADAEILALARQGLEAAGVTQASFVVGHLGAVLELLAQLGIEGRGQALVVAAMEQLAHSPTTAPEVIERLVGLIGPGRVTAGEEEGELAGLLQSFGSEATAEIAADLLERANLSLDGGARSPEEIVGRLVRKARQEDPRPNIERAVAFVQELRELAGPPDEALPKLKELLARWQLDDAPVRDVERSLHYFSSYFPEPMAIRVDLSFARGLRYYTGLVFEINDSEGYQIGGGGRYDDLVRSLGGKEAVPACGFAFGLERLAAASEREGNLPASDCAPSVLVAPLADDDCPLASRLAGELRQADITVEMDLRFRGLKGDLQHADKAGVPLLLIIGERERVEGVAALRDLRRFEDARIPLAEVTAAVRARLENVP
jgi:histidyl-tRNA synthetase